MSHKHFIQVSSLGMVPTNLKLVMQTKEVPTLSHVLHIKF